MQEEKKAVSVRKQDVGTDVITRVDKLMECGFTMPSDYNHVNAIKASMLVLNEMREKDGTRILDTCTPASIQTALFEMVTKGLDVSKNQGYFIKRGNKLCLDESYFGKVMQVRRIFTDFDPLPRVIYEGDKFEFTTESSTGKRILVKHEQSLANLDNDFVGAYMYIPCHKGGSDLYMMTRKQILTAWSKSSNKDQKVHKEFTEKMVEKTIINSACNMIIRSNTATSPVSHISDSENTGSDDFGYEEYVDVDNVEVVDTPAAEVQTSTAETPQGSDF